MQHWDMIKNRCADLRSVECVMRDDLIVLEIKNTAATAQIMMLGAQLIGFTPIGQKPVIWKSAQTTYSEGVPVRGGIPLIAPWFGDLHDNPDTVRSHVGDQSDAPAHGFARTSRWTLEEVDESADHETVIVFTLDDDSPHPDLWDTPLALRVTYMIGATLAIEMEVTNNGTQEVSVATALHTYFAVSDIDDVVIPSFDGVRYYDSCDAWKQKIWSGQMRITGETDMVLLNPPHTQEIQDAGWNRKIILTTSGSESCVLWNPWIDKAKRLSMFGDLEYKEMLCIETATVADDHKVIAPTNTYSYNVTISTQELAV